VDDFGALLAQPRRALVKGMHEGPDTKPLLAQQSYGRGSGVCLLPLILNSGWCVRAIDTIGGM
jgi:hypothetical protein